MNNTNAMNTSAVQKLRISPMASSDEQAGPALPTSLGEHDGLPKSNEVKKNAPPASHLGLKLAGDVAVGTGVTFLVAPFLSIVDQAIAQRASGTNTLLRSGMQSVQRMVSSPVAFVRSPAFLYVWAVYASTYSVANGLKTILEHQNQKQKAEVSSKQGTSTAAIGNLGIFLGTSLTNSGASVLKDRAYAQMFAADAGISQMARKVPVASYGLWMTRDLIGVGSSFVLPDILAQELPFEDKQRNRDISQFCVPIATQFVAGPLHLLGLDLFNRPLQDMPCWKQRVLDRGQFLLNGYGAVVSARIARIIPGYGFGGVLNTKLRDGWRNYLVEQREEGNPSLSMTGKGALQKIQDLLPVAVPAALNFDRQ